MSNASHLAHRHTQNVGLSRDNQDLTIYAENVVTEFPFAPEGHTRHLDGREALSQFLAAIGNFATQRSVVGITHDETEGGFVLTYTESSIFRSTSNPYSSKIVWIARVENGVISYLEEYYDSLAVMTALGEA
jgi:uncharacterized protein